MKYLKAYKLFEAYPPSQFEIQAERKFRKILPDLEDILVDVSDLGIKYDISKLIAEGSFELYINIHGRKGMRIKTQEPKKVVSEAVSRIKDYLDDFGIEFSSAEIHQTVETSRDLGFGLPEPSRGAKREIFYVYDINEVIDLVNSTGEIGLNLQWFWNNERDWKE